MGILVIALSINPRPLSALELKLSGLIMESRVDTAGDNQNAHVIISNYHTHDSACSPQLKLELLMIHLNSKFGVLNSTFLY